MRKTRKVFITRYYSARYTDGITARTARLHAEASLSQTAIIHGVKVGRVSEVRDLDRLLGYRVEFTRVF